MHPAIVFRKPDGSACSRPMPRLAMLLLCVAMTWHAAGCAADVGEQAPALLDRNHPLVDKILDVHSGAFISQAQLITRLPQSGYILLGETHDNRRHHEIQALSLIHISEPTRPY